MVNAVCGYIPAVARRFSKGKRQGIASFLPYRKWDADKNGSSRTGSVDGWELHQGAFGFCLLLQHIFHDSICILELFCNATFMRTTAGRMLLQGCDGRVPRRQRGVAGYSSLQQHWAVLGDLRNFLC
mmetsp:Transcript_23193/g.39797  ORF Transcript_23193/g.39797 Transcript_23193/m.39797 type:complete len:127 (-) Transcript_23193:907-1287(-)